jgi:hypothetical protein
LESYLIYRPIFSASIIAGLENHVFFLYGIEVMLKMITKSFMQVTYSVPFALTATFTSTAGGGQGRHCILQKDISPLKPF